jgi:hypothetical protein
VVCFELVTSLSTRRPEPGRNCKNRWPRPRLEVLDVSQAFVPGAASSAPTEEAGVKSPVRQKLIFWRFEPGGVVCFLEVTGRSTSGVWRFNLAQFARNARAVLGPKSRPLLAGRPIGNRNWNVGTEVGSPVVGRVERKGVYGARLEPF